MKERSRYFWHQYDVSEASVDLINDRDEAEDNQNVKTVI